MFLCTCAAGGRGAREEAQVGFNCEKELRQEELDGERLLTLFRVCALCILLCRLRSAEEDDGTSTFNYFCRL